MSDIEADSYLGHENLELLSQRYRFNDWLFNEVSHGLHGNILEVGSGIGTFTEKIINSFPNSHLTLTDISPTYIRDLKEKYSNNKYITVCKLDLNNKTDYENIGYKKFDSIIATNVLEHVENDEFALVQLFNMLKENGILVILVPCHKFLYNIIDKSVGHFRRYSKKDLEAKVRKTGFTINKLHYFNLLGMIGWFINGNLLKNSKISDTGLKIFDKLVPLSKYGEMVTGKRTGLSIICYLKK
jgi:2-polyprenyl-3-methyl-5-hydroxy-6-metoxy-1,4-benzoquinol methylase